MPKKKKLKKVSKLETIAEGDGAKTKEEEKENVADGKNDPKKGKKKKRKKIKRKGRATKDEKAKARIMKKVKEMMKNTEEYEKFTNKMDHWMLNNHRKVETFFGRLDDEDEGVIAVDIFNAGLHDLDCPITEMEFHLLISHLDPTDTGTVNYKNFNRGFIGRHSNNEDDDNDVTNRPDDYLPSIYTKSETNKMTSPNHPFYGTTPRYVQLDMRMASFDHFPSHPCHVTITVHNSIQISELCKLVARASRVTTGEMNIYTTSKCEAEERLGYEFTLEECGVRGANKRSPTQAVLYYDYSVEFSDCSLLTCDHYFD